MKLADVAHYGTEETICDVRHSVVIGAEAEIALTSADDGA
jgi:hypothetical protein